jgi:MFS family permease
VCMAGAYPPAMKIMATWFREGRGLAIGILVGALTVGSATPHLIRGVTDLPWRHTLLAASVLAVLSAVITHLFVREGPYAFPAARFDARMAAAVFRLRGARLATFGYLGHMWELYAMWAWFLVFFSHVLRKDGGTAGENAAFATFAVIGIGALGCWLGGYLGDRWGRTQTTALMMAISGLSALAIGLLLEAPTWLVLVIGLIWGFTVVADSAQFSTMVTELADQSYVGTALTLQLAVGFSLTVATIWLIPVLEESFGWRWAFAFLAPGPALGVLAMLRLRSLPEAALIADGRG